MSYLDYVNIRQGTDSSFRYSNGNTLPLTTMPFGMSSWSVQTCGKEGGWFFHPDDRHIEGIRLTHQPSPWIRDYGHFIIFPQTGPLYVKEDNRYSSYRPEDAVFRPDYLQIYLNRYGINMELTPTERGAHLRLQYDNQDNARLLFLPFGGLSEIEIDADNALLKGKVTSVAEPILPENFAQYFIMKFDCPINIFGSGSFNLEDGKLKDRLVDQGEDLGAAVSFDLPEDGIVNVKISTSFISQEQAGSNFAQELSALSFDKLREAAAQVWEDKLAKIEVESERLEDKQTFYSALYRCFLFPRIFYEYDKNSNQIHYSPFDGNIYDGPMYTDNGFWDVYRTNYPLLSILCPERLAEILNSWVNVYQENEWMPKWLSPNERGIMPGTLIDAIVADAAVKGIDFDIAAAYEGLKKHATQKPDRPEVGRSGLEEYLEYGYVPYDQAKESVNQTLDYVYGDFCIAQVAKLLGKEEDYQKFIRRSLNYKEIFDSETGFMRARDSSGEFKEDFNQYRWGGEYCEGGAWQNSWSVFHDVAGLASVLGGREELIAKIEELFAQPPTFAVGEYGKEIHEMSEMAAVNLGQCAISNQPSFNIPYLFTVLGRPDLTEYWKRRAMVELFDASNKGFPGDEDNGSLSAWYVFGAIGFYPFCPGVNQYVLSNPFFEKFRINLPNGRKLEIKANNSDEKIYTEQLRINNEEYNKLYITQEDIYKGGNWIFEMSDYPQEKEYKDIELPFSLSQSLE